MLSKKLDSVLKSSRGSSRASAKDGDSILEDTHETNPKSVKVRPPENSSGAKPRPIGEGCEDNVASGPLALAWGEGIAGSREGRVYRPGRPIAEGDEPYERMDSSLPSGRSSARPAAVPLKGALKKKGGKGGKRVEVVPPLDSEGSSGGDKNISRAFVFRGSIMGRNRRGSMVQFAGVPDGDDDDDEEDEGGAKPVRRTSFDGTASGGMSLLEAKAAAAKATADEEAEAALLLHHPDGIVGPAVPADAAMAMDMMDDYEFSEFVSDMSWRERTYLIWQVRTQLERHHRLECHS